MYPEIKHRKPEIEGFRMALNMCEIGIDYFHADLIIRISKKLNEAGNDLTISDTFDIFSAWKREVESYHKMIKQESKS